MWLVDIRIVVFAPDVVHVRVAHRGEAAFDVVIAVIPGASVINVHGVPPAAHVQRGGEPSIKRTTRGFSNLGHAEVRIRARVGVDVPPGDVDHRRPQVGVSFTGHCYRIDVGEILGDGNTPGDLVLHPTLPLEGPGIPEVWIEVTYRVQARTCRQKVGKLAGGECR